jgi:hypothetical protein
MPDGARHECRKPRCPNYADKKAFTGTANEVEQHLFGLAHWNDA